MGAKVLTGNVITRTGNGAYSLIGGDELQQLYRQRLATDSVLSGG